MIDPGSDNLVVVQDQAEGHSRWLRFERPEQIVSALTADEVLPALEAVDREVADGKYAAGFVTYEAAPGLDEALRTGAPGDLPLLWFGIYAGFDEIDSPAPASPDSFVVGNWRPSVSAEAHAQAVGRIRRHIYAGETYQVNYTFRLQASFAGDPWAFFAELHRAQRGRHSAFVRVGAHDICSASPELFFSRRGSEIVSRPMKGTAGRAMTAGADRERRVALAASEKNRAENIMITDMIRNDLGRVSEVDSVVVRALCEAETYPSLHQLTSTVVARAAVPPSQLLAAMFPCASITGAPKVETMKLIAELEPEPRGVYTGCIGYAGPEGAAQFNVAIRTAVIDRARGRATYGVGGGVVWDSDAADEYEECRTKARVLTSRPPPFSLLESLRWDSDGGYVLLDRHLDRLCASADYFQRPVAPAAVRQALAEFAQGLPGGSHKVRLLVDIRGDIRIEAEAIVDPSPGAGPLTVGVAAAAVAIDSPFLYHKTTHRAAYEEALAARPDCDDVILWNSAGQVTESTRANVVIESHGRRVTPPVACGLLAGVCRDDLLARGEIVEAEISLDALRAADAVYLVNSVRGWMPLRRGAEPDRWEIG